MSLMYGLSETIAKIKVVYSKKSETERFLNFFVRDLIQQSKIKGVEFYKEQEDMLVNDYYAFFKTYYNNNEYYEKHLKRTYKNKDQYYDYLLEKIYHDFLRNVNDKEKSLHYVFNKDKFLFAV